MLFLQCISGIILWQWVPYRISAATNGGIWLPSCLVSTHTPYRLVVHWHARCFTCFNNANIHPVLGSGSNVGKWIEKAKNARNTGSVVLKLGHRHIRWSSVKIALAQRIVFDWQIVSTTAAIIYFSEIDKLSWLNCLCQAAVSLMSVCWCPTLSPSSPFSPPLSPPLYLWQGIC